MSDTHREISSDATNVNPDYTHTLGTLTSSFMDVVSRVEPIKIHILTLRLVFKHVRSCCMDTVPFNRQNEDQIP